ncbi:hypothetical protein DFH07DRAFT_802895 [Mycena maculata]|uniref:DNA breaking-rejoining enzyme n=1 Tax=Mycena maculata TaxID=230809 RepID=A0AAD7IQB8_9AGAR|nr:hypothetical protein DFH07DRAFT_830700 [Mycena maculata]KAJ7772687.1 hypothetical protein DFH07DRAFT_802895 [Mycena maculata]
MRDTLNTIIRDTANEAFCALTRRRYGRFDPKRHAKHHSRISSTAEAKVHHAIQNAWAESTLKKYNQGLKAFLRFCDTEQINPDQRLPADEFLLCAFAASRAGEIAGVTARGAVAAVKAWHIINNAEWRGGIRLRYTLRGVENLGPSKHDQRPPVTEAMLRALDKDLDHGDPKDAAVFATACCAYWGQIRLGEILSETQGSFIAGRIPLASNLGPPSTPAGSRVLRLPYTKTKGNKGDDAMLCRQRSTSDPINAIEEHLKINSIPPELPLFSHRNKGGDLICLTRKKLMLRCNAIWSRYGWPSCTGHSFRIGGTTELLLAGVNPDVVQAMGRWKSDAFLVYWRRLDILAPLHAEFLHV